MPDDVRGDHPPAVPEQAPEQEPEQAPRPATFSDLFAVREYRALYSATTLSFLGDYIARAAITALVFQQTRSVGLSAAAFAISYLPWVLGGPVLAALAERFPYRRVMVSCDLARAAVISVVAVPGLPMPLILVLVFVAMLGAPPTHAARSALLPQVLPRDQLVIGIAANSATSQAAQVIGYLAGAALAELTDPRVALIIDAGTFVASAILLSTGLKRRPAIRAQRQQSNLLAETAAGFRLVFGRRTLRAIAVLVFGLTLFAIVPEGLAAAWARDSGGGTANGLDQGMIMAAGPAGFILGGLVISRLVRADRRQRLIRPFAVLAPLALVPALAGPPPVVVALMAMVSGFAVAGLLPVLNGIFVLALPPGFRARAFGVMQGGMQLTQGGAVLITGVLAERWTVPPVVGLWSVAGVVLMLVITARWPRPERFEAAIAEAEAAAADVVVPAGADDETDETAAAGGRHRARRWARVLRPGRALPDRVRA